MLSTKNLSHSYTKDHKFSFPDLTCGKDETLLILGNSGVGKTTLLHILAGILKPNAGVVTIGDSELYKMKGNKLDRFRGQNIGLVFQKPHFVSSITAEQNLLLSQKIAGRPIDKTKVKSILEKLNIYKRRTAKNYQMSQGEQQRLSIARALINGPKVILADEPTSALDDNNCESVVQLLQEQSKAIGASLIIVTHDGRLKEVFNNYIELS
jgi:putative ABC transport system ATP-binding protein